MKTLRSIFVCMLLAMAGNMLADNLQPANVEVAPGERATVSVALDNPATEYIMVEFWMTLPQGLSIPVDEDGYYLAEGNSNRFRRTHVIEVSQQGSVYHFLLYSTRNETFKGSSGELFNFTLEAAANVASGTYQGKITNQLYNDADKNEHNPADVTFGITVTGAPEPPVTITATSLSREYGEENPAFTYTVSGGELKGGEPAVTCEADKNSPVGTYAIKVAIGSVTNSNVTLVDGTLTVGKAMLTATAKSYARKQGEENPALEIDYSGFKNGETEDALAKKPVATTTANAASAPGDYPITVSGGEAKNYEFKYVNGTLTVLPAPITNSDNLKPSNVEVNPGQRTTVSVALENPDTEYIMVEFWMTLPQGLSIPVDEEGYYLAEGNSERFRRTHVMEVSQQEGSYHFLLYSTKNETFKGSSGELFNFTLEAAAGVAPGTYQGKIVNQLYNDANKNEYNPADVTFGITVTGGKEEAYVVFKNKTLSFYYDGNKDTRDGLIYQEIDNNVVPAWFEIRESVTKVIINPSFNVVKPISTRMWFAFPNMTEIEGLEHLNTSQVTNMQAMFLECSKLASVNLKNFNTSNVTNMSYLFYNCSSLDNLDVSNFVTSKVTDMSVMFYGCSGLTKLDLTNFNTRNVTNMSWMFYGCEKLESLDLSHFDTSNVTEIRTMFYGCKKLNSLDLSNFNTSKVETMRSMFGECENLKNLKVGSFDTENVKSMQLMFYKCEKLGSLEISNFNTRNVTEMDSMFFHCNNLKKLDVSSFEIGEATHTRHMLHCPYLGLLKISSSMGKLDGSACYGVGSSTNPCTIDAPIGFDFGTDTSREYFVWKSGYFTKEKSNKDNLKPNDVGVDPGQRTTVSVALDNPDTEYIMVEFWMTLPQGLSIPVDEDGYYLAEGNSERFRRTHVMEVSLQEGSYHFLIYSTKNETFKGSSGELFTFTLEAAANATPGTYQGKITKQLYNDADKNEHTPADVTFNITIKPDGITSPTVGLDANQPLYNLQGIRVTSPKHGVYIQNGRKVTVK